MNKSLSPPTAVECILMTSALKSISTGALYKEQCHVKKETVTVCNFR